MSRQSNIVSFDAARRAVSGRAVPAGARPTSGARVHAGRFADDPDFEVGVVRGGRASSSTARGTRPAPLSMRDAHRGPDSLESRGAWDEELSQEEDELDAPLGPVGRLTAKFGRKRRQRAKERAGRAYYQQYEAGKSSDASTAGPRAAVYKGEMGASHRRSSRMQQKSGVSGSSRGFASSSHSFSFRGPLMAVGAVAACLVLGVLFLYGPSQQLYVDIRERDRLAAEYEAVVDRNEAIEAQVEALSTEAGVEDAARTQFGWVKEGEHAVSVSGLEQYEPENNFRGNIVSEDIPLPETWYSGILDPLFGVE